MLVQCNLNKMRRSIVDEGGTLIIVGKLEEFLA